MQIQSFSLSDTSEVASLFRKTVAGINSKDYNPDQIKAWVSAVDDEESFGERLSSSISLVARIDNKIVGFINLLENGHLDCLYVHEGYQRQGIASALLQRIEDRAKKAFHTTIRTDSCITALHFFEHHGFELVQDQNIEFSGVTFKNYVMEKAL